MAKQTIHATGPVIQRVEKEFFKGIGVGVEAFVWHVMVPGNSFVLRAGGVNKGLKQLSVSPVQREKVLNSFLEGGSYQLLSSSKGISFQVSIFSSLIALLRVQWHVFLDWFREYVQNF